MYCHKPGCRKETENGAMFCDECHYPGVEDDWKLYRACREDGYGVYQSKLMVGWADPEERDD